MSQGSDRQMLITEIEKNIPLIQDRKIRQKWEKIILGYKQPDTIPDSAHSSQASSEGSGKKGKPKWQHRRNQDRNEEKKQWQAYQAK